MKKLIILCFLASCSSLPNLSEMDSVTRERFLHEAGPKVFKNVPNVAHKTLITEQDFYEAGLCSTVFPDGYQFKATISRGEVASCLAPYLVMHNSGYQSFHYKDMACSGVYTPDVSNFEHAGLMKADSIDFFGVNRPITGPELQELLETIYDN